MKFNAPNSTKSKHIRWLSNYQGGHQKQFRSYTCSFCKRGFSNAQALGGHMNIHRRDRAKLKQSYEENLLSLDISIKNKRVDSYWEEEVNSNNHKMPFTFPEKDNNGHHHAPKWGKVISTTELVHLPSFVDEEKEGLDLELRLGREPKKAPILSMREFF